MISLSAMRCSNAVSGAEYAGGDERLRLGRFGDFFVFFSMFSHRFLVVYRVVPTL